MLSTTNKKRMRAAVAQLVEHSPTDLKMFKRSKPPAPPSPKLLHADWRQIPSWEKDDYLQYINNYEPDQKEVEHLRILLHGPSNAGKSSFINSVETALRGRMTGQALVGVGNDSFTSKYQMHKIQKRKPGNFYPFVFNDIMGLEKDNKGINVDDIKEAMKGHVKDGYAFNPHSSFSSEDLQHYNKSPTVNDQTHVLVCVVSASTLSIMSPEVIDKMKVVRLAAKDLGIPQMAIVTKIDEACPEVQSNLRNVYRSKFVKNQIDKLSVSLGIPLNCIFPVKNYHKEICRDDDIEKLILMALKQMIDFGEDFVNNCTEKAI
ncbi:interferon-induced protein 44-like isoform X2 [Boleophthalmus pectinirostris]|uniref:interferon-induced protein 44-like isoform X2 n=1 Tax=Boleophthalmus pectinirostris TaxID=150288 RepID=UPI00243288E6|nr:interferon-induced protein 44-like isoform X2 [Boleophthalmus pectinirostris]